MHAIAPARGSVFKLRHQDRRHCHHLHQIYQIIACDGPRRRLRFQVTAQRPSLLSPPSPDLSDPCLRWPPPEAPFSSYGTKTVTTVTTFTISIRFMKRTPLPEAHVIFSRCGLPCYNVPVLQLSPVSPMPTHPNRHRYRV